MLYQLSYRSNSCLARPPYSRHVRYESSARATRWCVPNRVGSAPATDPLDEEAELETLFADDPSLLALVRVIQRPLARDPCERDV
jgi:hypothetical protein